MLHFKYISIFKLVSLQMKLMLTNSISIKCHPYEFQILFRYSVVYFQIFYKYICVKNLSFSVFTPYILLHVCMYVNLCSEWISILYIMHNPELLVFFNYQT